MSIVADGSAATRLLAKPDLGLTGRQQWAVIAYGAMFAVGLPAVLIAWMRRLDTLVALPQIGSPAAGWMFALAGAAVIAVAVASLWRFGRGLPMSPFPPERLVSRGPYALVSDPIYVGSAMACAGVAMAAGSAAGIWIVTPVFAAAMFVFVAGYEREATARRFGPLPRPLLSIPPDDAAPAGTWDRVAVWVLALAPWAALYLAVERLGVPPGARSTYLPGEAAWPVIPWSEGVYFLAYPFVALAPLAAARRRDLRRFALDGLASTAAIIPFYLLVPLVAEAKPVPVDSAWSVLMRIERAGDSAVTAFPAFHVVWVCIAAAVYVARWPRLRLAAGSFVVAIGASCVATGMHASLDIVAGLAAYGLVRARAGTWLLACRLTERVANSWRERTVGRVRFLNHGVYAGVGSAAGVALASCMAGNDVFWWILAMTLAAEAGAGVWAQVVEGSSQLLRPYGYFGGVIGAISIAPIAWSCGVDPWRLLAGMCVGGCIAQAFGRVRCLIQGCCHGRPVDAPWGIRYRHPRSRVLRLSGLGGVSLHPTPLYSILWSLGVCAVLVRLWTLAVPLPFIGGMYLVLIGLGRFVEEHYRGEPQTAWVAGLRLYQWLAIGFIVAGGVVTTISGAAAPLPERLAASSGPALALLGVVTYAAFGVDFPRSDRKFSRLV